MIDLTEVFEKWSLWDLEPIPASDRAKVFAAFVGLGKKFSSDVVDLYSATSGMDDEMDGHCWSLWSLGRLIEENNTVYSTHPDIYFADFLINSHEYCFRFESDTRSSVYVDFGSHNLEKLADSVEEFFHIYMRNPESLAMFGYDPKDKKVVGYVDKHSEKVSR